MYHLRSSKHRRFPTIIVDRRHFDDIVSNDVEPFQTVDDRQQLPRGPASDFCRSSGYLQCQPRVQNIAVILFRNKCIERQHSDVWANSPGAKAGSRTSISTEMYTIVSPTRFLSLSTMPCTPIRSMSLAVMVSKPHRMSFRMSPFRLINGARIPAWIEELRIQPSSWARWRKVPIGQLQLYAHWDTWLLYTMIDASVRHPSEHSMLACIVDDVITHLLQRLPWLTHNGKDLHLRASSTTMLSRGLKDVPRTFGSQVSVRP